eukprot:Skav224201  [mRNA]  locus=scaffold939:676589:676915:+ [translate_table: standard]
MPSTPPVQSNHWRNFAFPCLQSLQPRVALKLVEKWKAVVFGVDALKSFDKRWEAMELNQKFCPESGSLQYDNMMVVSEIVLSALRMRKAAEPHSDRESSDELRQCLCN